MEPALAALLSFLLVGLGQMVLGQTIKGVVMLIVALVLGALTGCVACLVTFPVSAIDAYLIAKKLKEGKSVGEWEFF
jgi:TM2 domain-containing membrane protein YozV